jgi:hypothetical protein
MSYDLNFTALEHQDFLKFTDSLMECFQSEILKHSSLGNNEEKHKQRDQSWYLVSERFRREDIYDVFIPILKLLPADKCLQCELAFLFPLPRLICPLLLLTEIYILLSRFDENENDIPLDAVTSNTHVIAILEIKGIKCTSRNFTVELVLKQMMVMNPSSALDTDCLLVSRAKTIRLRSLSIRHTTTATIRMYRNRQHWNRNAVPLKTSFSEDVDVFNVPSRRFYQGTESFTGCSLPRRRGRRWRWAQATHYYHREAPGSDSSIDIGIEDIQDLSIDGENIELAEIQDIGDSNIELAEIQDIGDSNIDGNSGH